MGGGFLFVSSSLIFLLNLAFSTSYIRSIFSSRFSISLSLLSILLLILSTEATVASMISFLILSRNARRSGSIPTLAIQLSQHLGHRVLRSSHPHGLGLIPSCLFCPGGSTPPVLGSVRTFLDIGDLRVGIALKLPDWYCDRNVCLADLA